MSEEFPSECKWFLHIRINRENTGINLLAIKLYSRGKDPYCPHMDYYDTDFLIGHNVNPESFLYEIGEVISGVQVEGQRIKREYENGESEYRLIEDCDYHTCIKSAIDAYNDHYGKYFDDPKPAKYENYPMQKEHLKEWFNYQDVMSGAADDCHGFEFNPDIKEGDEE